MNGTQIETLEAEAARLRKALAAINDIRNSIIGLRTVNWSEHIYPLVAALEDAGIEGMGYPKARKHFGTMLERTAAAEARLSEILDPPICRRQFPDGGVPGNIVECAEGWKRNAERLWKERDEFKASLSDAQSAIEALRGAAGNVRNNGMWVTGGPEVDGVVVEGWAISEHVYVSLCDALDALPQAQKGAGDG